MWLSHKPKWERPNGEPGIEVFGGADGDAEQSSAGERLAETPDTFRETERADRRRNAPAELTPDEVLRNLPALVVLERIPVPVVAIDHHGHILFVNLAFATMLGRTRAALRRLSVWHILQAPSAGAVSALELIHIHAETLVELQHADGWIVRAVMSRSALQRKSDTVALVAFHDLTEQLWAGKT
ncbi:PAS domain S-box protein [Mycobacterium hodleri]|uniref:PAS domain S-box protein n=2 Tax=Mycolicibacterium hodleri TaxID=49897 RepID=A0A502E471_9MYCO|nr:PAS domain S-box protein [Mycolicibacterium hodleri]